MRASQDSEPSEAGPSLANTWSRNTGPECFGVSAAAPLALLQTLCCCLQGGTWWVLEDEPGLCVFLQGGDSKSKPQVIEFVLELLHLLSHFLQMMQHGLLMIWT